jgi:hypothetical protein
MSEKPRNTKLFLQQLNTILKTAPQFTYGDNPQRIIEVRSLAATTRAVDAVSISRNSSAQFLLVLEDGSELNVFIKPSNSFRVGLELEVTEACMQAGINTFKPVCTILQKLKDSYWITETVFGVAPISTIKITTEEELRKAILIGFHTLARLNSLGYSHNDPYPHKNIAVDIQLFHQPLDDFDPEKAGYIFDFEWAFNPDKDEAQPQSWQNCLNEVARFCLRLKEDLELANNQSLLSLVDGIFDEIAAEYESKYPF